MSAPKRSALALALAALGLFLRAALLGSQPLIGDDASVGRTAMEFVGRGLPEPTMWNHPRLRDLLVRASLALFGEGAWGIKLWSVLLGTLAAPAAALLVLSLGGGLPGAVVAGLVVATDPLHLDFSRQGINDVYLAFLPVAAVLALVRYRAAARPAWLALAGLLLVHLANRWDACGVTADSHVVKPRCSENMLAH